MNEWVSDVAEASFESAVLQESKTTPVVVDFWAPWCGPCRTLGPMLERLAEEHAGQFRVAKVNVDENPRLAQAFRIQSIPRLIAFKEGRPAVDLVGAVPEGELRRFLGQVLPSPAEQMARRGQQLLAGGELAEAERELRSALEHEPRCLPAILGLARILADRGETDAALELLERAGPGVDEVERLAAEIRVGQGAETNEPELRARLARDAGDLDVRLQLGHALAARGEHEEALQQYLEIIRVDRAFQDEAARKGMLDVFEVLGPSHPLVERYRAELAKVLFS